MRVCNRKTVLQDPRPQPLTVVGWEQVEVIKADVVGGSRERDGADGLSMVHDARHWAGTELLLMEGSLKRLVPSPSGDDVRAQSCPFDLKGEVDRFRRLGQAVETDVGRQVRNIHGLLLSQNTHNHDIPAHFI